jgi:queuine tRNA-ribosyltransferase
VRTAPERLRFEIEARDGDARRGVLHTAHGPVVTPAFVPLATKGSVRTLTPPDVSGLGFEMVLGNTFHLFLQPGHELIARAGGLHEFMGWSGPLITDSGGFQVFSLAHGGVADEIKGRRGSIEGGKAVVDISEEGVGFRDLHNGDERFIGPETSMEIQAALGSDIALVFDECTPFNADRDYTARSMERTHRWLQRCLDWHDAHGPPGQAVYGIVQGGVHADLRRTSAEAVAAAAVDGVAIGGTLGRDKPEMYGVLDMTVPHLPADAPKHLLGIGEIDDLLAGIARGIDTFDCAVPTRLGRHGVALAPEPGHRFRLDLTKGAYAEDFSPPVKGCPCEACRHHTRAYLHHLGRAKELTGARLLTLHNLAYTQELVRGAREAIEAGRLAAYSEAMLGGATPWEAGGQHRAR